MAPDHHFDHLALLYEGDDEFVARTAPFVREGVATDEPVLVATSADKCDRLATALNGAAAGVEFVDMTAVGRNPATIIPVWERFAGKHRDRPVRGIGEPVWPGRSEPELDECEHHESLLNLAFADRPAFQLVCPYDVATLDPTAIERAHRTHPRLLEDGRVVESLAYVPPEAGPGPFAGPLSPVPPDAATLRIAGHDVSPLRRFVSDWALGSGLGADRTQDLTLAVHELATNSIVHGGGSATLRAWQEGDALVCEVRDGGHISEPLAGRRLPGPTAPRGRGLWIVNHLCDLVQIRSGPDGNVVRVRIDLVRSRVAGTGAGVA